MDYHHPILREMLQLGCSDQMKVMVAFETYMKLCEVDKLRDVEVLYDKELEVVYLSSAESKERTLHVPVPSQQHVSPAWLHTVSSTLRLSHPGAQINILLRTPDSTLLPYKLTEGLCPPPTPDSTKEKKAIQEKVQYIQSELNKRKTELYEEAKRKKTVDIEAEKHKPPSDVSQEEVKIEKLESA